MITVLNLGTANIGSVLNMLRRIRVPATVAEGAQDIEKATKIIMPGVGHFSNSVERLAALPYREALDHAALVDQKPILGICLGMQLMTRGSEEGEGAGLGWVAADTVRFRAERVDDNREETMPRAAHSRARSRRSVLQSQASKKSQLGFFGIF